MVHLFLNEFKQPPANLFKTGFIPFDFDLFAEYARQGKDWETELTQRAKEKQLMTSLGLLSEPKETATLVEEDDDDEE